MIRRDRCVEVSLFAVAVALATAGCPPPQTSGVAIERPQSTAARDVPILITRRGFEPARVDAREGEVVRLIFTRTIARTCVTSVVLWLSQDDVIERELPLDVAVSITLELRAAGDVGFACPMRMYGGRVQVE